MKKVLKTILTAVGLFLVSSIICWSIVIFIDDLGSPGQKNAWAWFLLELFLYFAPFLLLMGYVLYRVKLIGKGRKEQTKGEIAAETIWTFVKVPFNILALPFVFVFYLLKGILSMLIYFVFLQWIFGDE